MSVEIYTRPFFKGHKILLDIGFYETDLPDYIGSFIIYDNVQLEIIYIDDKKMFFCGEQIKNKLNIKIKIKSINVKHSICDPYTDINSITNKYIVGKNYSILVNTHLKPKTTEEIVNNGFLDFWYNKPIPHNYVVQKNKEIEPIKPYDIFPTSISPYKINKNTSRLYEHFENNNNNNNSILLKIHNNILIIITIFIVIICIINKLKY
jgi:hypothetical protein